MTRLCSVGLRPISSSFLPFALSEPSRFRFRRLARFRQWPIGLSTPSPSMNVAIGTSAGSTWRAAWQQPVYLYPDPIPEFAKAETRKFEDELRKKLVKSKEVFRDDVDEVVKICAEIFKDFLETEYGGPGTLLVEPFTDMLLGLKVNKLPGAAVAARAALLWAQNCLDQDWEIWNFQQSH
ncbi:hypothetical protein ZIOFF_073934 [Zingiber officinale]|uniref:Uncharacterized protein n=1 Tax=Zingiber officinale TaxID=94328 RepID=A0A8J5EMS9_ZINOF|nr:hypothetical protein ZIOFF_073934 [Zingiber officinale]